MLPYLSSVRAAEANAPIIDMRGKTVAVQPPAELETELSYSDDDLFEFNAAGPESPNAVILRGLQDFPYIRRLCADLFGYHKARRRLELKRDMAHERAHHETITLLGGRAVYAITIWKLLYPGDHIRTSFSFGVTPYHLITTRLGYAAIAVRPRDIQRHDAQLFVDLGYRDLNEFGQKAWQADLPTPLALASRKWHTRAQRLITPLKKTAPQTLSKSSQ